MKRHILTGWKIYKIGVYQDSYGGGHQIPAYYCEECGHINVAKSAPNKCEKCGSDKLHQDPDTLDTWFSSALWPFSTLGWPNKRIRRFKNFLSN